MNKLADVSTEVLRDELADVSDPKAAKRLMVALAYDGGISISTQSEIYGIPESTLYYWIDRVGTKSLKSAIHDDDRPGRPTKLDREERTALRRDLMGEPTESGYDATDWSPELVRRHIEDEYGVSYSLGHIRRLVRKWSVDRK
ncbi:transposase [Haladaptatus sp. CMAA 1911]|uniref:helix-turn-helix domain-containing protein n=1 Tax=unclassified Haladaptatus TaxID=2622732 RepID=UPI0037545B7E